MTGTADDHSGQWMKVFKEKVQTICAEAESKIVEEFARSVVRAGEHTLYGIERRPNETDEELAQRVAEVSGRAIKR